MEKVQVVWWEGCMCTQVVPLGSAPTLLPACVIRGLYLIEFVDVDGDFGSREELFYTISWDFAILSVQPLCCVKSSVLSCVLLFQRLRLSRSSSLFLIEKRMKKLLSEQWFYAWDDVFRSKELGGSWSADGCKVVSSASNGTVCECNHLTSFTSISVYDKVQPEHFNSLHMLPTFYPAKHAFPIVARVVEFARALCDYNVKELRSRDESKDTEKRVKWTAPSLLSPT